MAKLGPCAHICLYLSITAVVFLSFMTYLAYTDPVRIKITHPGQEHGAKAAKAWTSCGVATFLYALIAGLLLFLKYSDKEASRDLDQWTETQRGGNLAGETRQYELNPKEYMQIQKDHEN